MSLSEKDVQNLTGLTEKEVQKSLREHGYNELPGSQKRNIFKIILEIFKEPMFLLLVACGSLYLILGDIREALFLLGFVFVVIGLTIYQENKAERALDALKDLSSPRALVIRDGERKRIAGREVVLDDFIILEEGDRVPADAVLIWEQNLSIDESLLTGESVPVMKTAVAEREISYSAKQPGGDDHPFVFSGSLVVHGRGIAKVIAIGAQTSIGKIGKALKTIESEQTVLQKETKRLISFIFIIVAILCSAVVIAYGLLYKDWIDGILSGLTLAMAILPEEFPVVVTVFLALGAFRIAKKKVLTRKMGAVEILGAATVLCVDKTGTLTQNKMSIKKIVANFKSYDIEKNKHKSLPENFHELIEYAILASKKDPFDPMEKALRELGEFKLKKTEHLHEEWPMLKEYPLSKELLALSHVWKCTESDMYMVAAKGAPEAIADLCHMKEKDFKILEKYINELAKEGLRVLGVAKAGFKEDNLPKSQHDFSFEFLGLVGLADPIRETVPSSIAECYGAGIRVVMITGDYPITAQNIGKQIGLKSIDHVITGADLEKMDEKQLVQEIKYTNIFARVVPEQKLLIVQALKKNGEIVAMTGDGVNDAPALKAAHIGVAMGERGTDVARESAALVLLKDDFTSIVAAVRLGRRVFDNIKKAIAYVISVHIPIAGLSLLPVILNWPIILYPVHIVFLELIIDPSCSIAFESEKEEQNIMERPPRDPLKPLFGKKMILISFFQGFVSFIIMAVIFKMSLYFDYSIEKARTFAFVALIVSNLSLILSNRSWEATLFTSLKNKNKSLKYIIFGAFLFLLMAIYIPFFNDVFKFVSLKLIELFVIICIGFASILWFELFKMMALKRHKELL